MIRWVRSRLRRDREWERFRRERWDRSRDQCRIFLRRSFPRWFYSISRCRSRSRYRFQSLRRSLRGRVYLHPRETLRGSLYHQCRAGRARNRDWWIRLLRSSRGFRPRTWVGQGVSRYLRERRGRCLPCQNLRGLMQPMAAGELCCCRMSRRFQSQWNCGCRLESLRQPTVAAGRWWKHSATIRNIF